MEIKRIREADDSIVEQIVVTHLLTLSDSFLNNFGKYFLKIIYQNSIDSEDSICLILSENEKVEGFALATKNYSTFFKNALRKNKVSLLINILKESIFNPKNILLLTKSLPNLLFSKEEPRAELQFIAVSTSQQGKGYGSSLVRKLTEELSDIGINQFYVGTQSSDPLSNKFYQKMGFTKQFEKTYFGKKLNYYLSPKSNLLLQ